MTTWRWRRAAAVAACPLVACPFLPLALVPPALAIQAGPGDAITVTADRVEYAPRSHAVRADGHVEARTRDVVITADHLEANTETQDVTAAGHVTLAEGRNRATGSRLTYNMRTKVGRVEEVAGQFGVWHISGQAVDVAPTEDVATEASITPCDPAHPFYKVTARKIVVVPDQYFTAYDASLWVAGVRVITLPVYTARLGRQSGPSGGYNSVDGVYLEYADSFPVGEFRNDYRIRLATTTSLSAEDILSDRIADHVWSLHLGRNEFLDTSNVLVNVDEYSVNLNYDRGKIPGAPVDIQFEAHGGSYGELATGVTTTRAEGILTLATDTFQLSPVLSFSAGGRAHFDSYGTGQQRTVFELSGVLSDSLSPRESAALAYSNVSVTGSTPFQFDVYGSSSVASLSYNYVFGGFVQSATTYVAYDFLAMQTVTGLTVSLSVSPTTTFNVSAAYNLTTQQLAEVDYSVNVQCDCVTIGLVYRTFPQSPSANNFLLMAGLNAF